MFNDKPKPQQNKRGSQMCNWCGEPRKGHDCPSSGDKLIKKYVGGACKDKGERELPHQETGEGGSKAETRLSEAIGDCTAERHRKQAEPLWKVTVPQQKADNQSKPSTDVHRMSTKQLYIAPSGEDDRTPTAQAHRAFGTDNQEPRREQEDGCEQQVLLRQQVTAKHDMKQAPPSSSLHDDSAIKDTRPVKRPKLNVLLQESRQTEIDPILDGAQNELPGVETKDIHPNETKTTSTFVQMEPQDLITQDFDPDTGDIANKRMSL